MNSQQLTALILDPASAGADASGLLGEIINRYPYCQTAQLLYTYNLLRTSDAEYPARLRVTAAYAGDRSVLRELLLKGKGSRPEPTVDAEPVRPDEAVSEGPVVSMEGTLNIPAEEPTSRLAGETGYERLSREELLAIVKKRLAEIDADRRGVVPETAVPSPSAGPEEIPEEVPGKISMGDLIDKFIREEPSISRPTATFFNPSDSAMRSNFDDEEIVTETLAMLYARQGNIQKAIHIYEKLSLLNQEKSRYFAAQIENLKS